MSDLLINLMIRYTAYGLMGLLIMAGVFATKTAYGQEWYPGENVQQGLYMKYQVSHFDYKRGAPFEVTLWFGSQDDRKNWITDVTVVEKGQVVTGKFTLSSITLTPVGFPSDELQPYQAPIKDSIMWIGGYASKINQKSLTGSKVWGVIAAIGGGSITVAPVGTEMVQAAGKSWDTYVIGWHYGEDSKIWVADNFPLPISGKAFALTTQKPIPVQFEFRLLETGMSDTAPKPPVSKVEIPTPPLTTTTTSAIFKVDLYWEPVSIEPGKPTKFGVVVFDQQGNLVDNVRYLFKIVDAKGSILIDDQFLTEGGQGTHEVTFSEAGGADVTVTVLRELPGVAEPIREEADFEIVVVPEFPLGLAIVMASLIGIMIVATRFKKLNIPRL